MAKQDRLLTCAAQLDRLPRSLDGEEAESDPAWNTRGPPRGLAKNIFHPIKEALFARPVVFGDGVAELLEQLALFFV